jgi:hypothetical protein
MESSAGRVLNDAFARWKRSYKRDSFLRLYSSTASVHLCNTGTVKSSPLRTDVQHSSAKPIKHVTAKYPFMHVRIKITKYLLLFASHRSTRYYTKVHT